MLDCYSVLDITPSATLDEIKSAYRVQALKWHPDKNLSTDTNEKMQEINEAKLILTDKEARIKYDLEYPYYQSFKRNDQQQTTYQFEDEVLKRWMENAKKQAHINLHEMILEFRESSIIGFGTFIRLALMALFGSAIYLFIIFVLKLMIDTP